MNTSSIAPETEWPGDVLNRKPYANFMTSYLSSRVMDRNGSGLTSFALALDAQWGQGKTFFITNWAKDLSTTTPTHPTLVFDAWSADYATDPLVAFMAAFKATLDGQIEKAGLAVALRKKATQRIATAVTGLRRAILPASKQIAKGVLRKATGIAVEEIIDTYSDSIDTVSEDKLTKAGLEAVNKGLDEFFKHALAEQAERKAAIREFRNAIEVTLKELVEHGSIALPMFVFVDEIDRCRPSFAISLLESVKHLFGIPGVCFVVSTNMSQLSESVKAVYGLGFDGYGYLKRFFDAEYSLPTATGNNFTKLLLAEHPELEAHSLSLGLPRAGFDDTADKMNACYALTWVAEVFDLDLRSQRRIFEMISATAAGVAKDKKVFLLWLAILCAIKHKSPEAFEELANSRESPAEFEQAWEKVAVADGPRRVRLPARLGGDSRPVTLNQVAWHYYECMHLSLEDISREQGDGGVNAYDYPKSVTAAVLEEMPSVRYSDQSYMPSIAVYFDLVRTAGHLSGF